MWEELSERQRTHNENFHAGILIRETLNQKNIANDLIYVEVLITANIASDAVRNIQHRR